MRKIGKKVDNDPPSLNVKCLLRTVQLKRDLRRFEQIHTENKNMMCQIVKIRRCGGVVDSYNPIAGKQSSNLQFHRSEIERIEKENLAKYQRIVNAKPAVILNTELMRSWKQNLNRIEKGSRFPLILPGIYRNLP